MQVFLWDSQEFCCVCFNEYFCSFIYKQSKYQQLVPVLLSCTWGLRSDVAKLWSAPYNFTMMTTVKTTECAKWCSDDTSVGNNMETNNSNTLEGKKLDTSKYRNHVNRTKYVSSRNKHSYPKLWAINWEFSFGICGGKKEYTNNHKASIWHWNNDCRMHLLGHLYLRYENSHVTVVVHP